MVWTLSGTVLPCSFFRAGSAAYSTESSLPPWAQARPGHKYVNYHYRALNRTPVPNVGMPPNFKVAFVADMGLVAKGPVVEKVLKLIQQVPSYARGHMRVWNRGRGWGDGTSGVLRPIHDPLLLEP